MKKLSAELLKVTAHAHKLAERQGLPVFVCEFQELDGTIWLGCRFNEHAHVDGQWFNADRFTMCRVLKVVQHSDNCQRIPYMA